MKNCRLFAQTVILLVVILMFLSSVGIVPVVAGEPLDNGPYVSRSNVMTSTVDSSFWDDPEPLIIKPVSHLFDFQTAKWPKISRPVTYQIIISPQAASTGDFGSIISKSQEIALILVNNPYYQAGYSAFMLDDNQQVQLSSLKYEITRTYYGRTDLSSSWVTKFYTAAYSEDIPNLTRLLEDLPQEI